MLMACKGDQVDRYLLPTVKGDLICAMAITEPGAGSDAASITTTAKLEGRRVGAQWHKAFHQRR